MGIGISQAKPKFLFHKKSSSGSTSGSIFTIIVYTWCIFLLYDEFRKFYTQETPSVTNYPEYQERNEDDTYNLNSSKELKFILIV